MSFGRKGLAPGAAAPAMRVGGAAVRGVGTTGARPAAPARAALVDDPYKAEREAFLAAERARREEPSDSADPLAHLRNGARPATRDGGLGGEWNAKPEVAVQDIARKSAQADYAATSTRSFFFGDPRKRTLMMAYVYWYFCGSIGLHRIYCGHKDSGLAQAGLFFSGLVLGLIYLPLGVAAIGAWFLWIFADLFLIPGMMRRFKEQLEPRYEYVFA